MVTNSSRARAILGVAIAVGATAQSGCRNARSESKDIAGGTYALTSGDCSVHDPAIAVENGQLYIFSTDTGPQAGYNGNLLIRCGAVGSNTTFAPCGQIFSSMNEIPWVKKFAPSATNIWAPDVTWWNGQWHVYYAVSEFGKEISVIGLATRSTLDQSSAEKWADRGPVLSTNGTQGYNAIDPSIIIDPQGQTWMVFGSFWKGIQLVKINPSTGLIDPSFPVTNVGNRQESTDAIEGSFMIYRAPYYYLFASFDLCCKGAQSTYNVRFGRSQSVSGPFLDEAGVSMVAGGGTKILEGAYGWAAGGGQSILRETVNDDVSMMIVHAYDGVTGDPWANIVGLQWNNTSGWPSLVPYAL